MRGVGTRSMATTALGYHATAPFGIGNLNNFSNLHFSKM